jgi:hypothetical protein
LKLFRQVQAGDADPVVGHSVIDVEPIRCIEIVTPVSAYANDPDLDDDRRVRPGM